MSRIGAWTRGGVLSGALLSYMATYFVLQRSGLFAVEAESTVWIVYSNASLAGAGMLGLVLAFRFFVPQSQGAAGWVLRVGVAFLVVSLAGLFWGRASRFEGRMILTEGQIFSGQEDEYLSGSVRTGHWARPPRLEMTVTEAVPAFSGDRTQLDSLEARVQIVFPEKREILPPTTLSRQPVYVRGNWLWLGEFGYSPYYRLKDDQGKLLDESFVYLQLFPPGSEDSFRLLTPHTFYVRYTPPSAVETGPEASADRGRYHLRIVRNKLILADADLFPGQEQPFDNAAITLESPRRWVEVVLVRDYGMILSVWSGLAGLVLVGISRLLFLSRREPVSGGFGQDAS